MTTRPVVAVAARGAGACRLRRRQPGRHRPAARRQARPGQPRRHAGAVDGHAEPRGARVQGGAAARLRTRRRRRHRRRRLQSGARPDEGGRLQGGARHAARCARRARPAACPIPAELFLVAGRGGLSQRRLTPAPLPPRSKRSTGRRRIPTPCRAPGSSAVWSRPSAATARRSARRSRHCRRPSRPISKPTARNCRAAPRCSTTVRPMRWRCSSSRPPTASRRSTTAAWRVHYRSRATRRCAPNRAADAADLFLRAGRSALLQGDTATALPLLKRAEDLARQTAQTSIVEEVARLRKAAAERTQSTGVVS